MNFLRDLWVGRHHPVNALERRRLRKLPRYIPTTSKFLDRKIHVVDACTFLVGIDEIFIEHAYNFNSAIANPTIIDCGANIGLSVIYFKQLYPDCNLIVFEADPNVFNCLRQNVDEFQLTNTELYNRAVWSSDAETLKFRTEGGFSGRIETDVKNDNLISVKTTRLKNYLTNLKIDFLKIDIEGAETEVLRDCKDELNNVDTLFVEWHSQIGQQQTLDELLLILKNAGFRYHIKDAYTALNPFKERPSMMGMDLQLNVFAFR